jgi:hypothetical protein
VTDICHHLHNWAGSRRRFGFPFESAELPKNGIYILFEKGEHAHGGDRIVRIGTHRGQGQLRSRLKQHFLRENKDRSIFRKNIGRALLAKTNDPFAPHWEIDLTDAAAKVKHAGAVDQARQSEVERDVSQRIQSSFTFVVFEVETKEDRLCLESKLISTVSLCMDCQSSPTWLGRYSPKLKIRESGLWLVNELYKEPLCQSDLARFRACP